MECPYCSSDSRVLDSRRSGDEVRRRRECLECGRRFTTYERLAPPEIRVSKRGGRPSEGFDRDKLLRALGRVTRGRVPGRDCLAVARGLEAELVAQGVQSITSGELAERLLSRLRDLDPLSATRFASNYADENGVLVFVADQRAPSPQLALPLPVPEAAPVRPPAPRRTRRSAGR